MAAFVCDRRDGQQFLYGQWYGTDRQEDYPLHRIWPTKRRSCRCCFYDNGGRVYGESSLLFRWQKQIAAHEAHDARSCCIYLSDTSDNRQVSAKLRHAGDIVVWTAVGAGKRVIASPRSKTASNFQGRFLLEKALWMRLWADSRDTLRRILKLHERKAS